MRDMSDGCWMRVGQGFNLNSEIDQVVLLLVLVLEKSRHLSVTLTERNGARRFGPCFDAQSQQIEHEHDFQLWNLVSNFSS
jgi:hypothetical protein